MKRGYTEFVGGKVHPKDFKLLKESQYNVRHAVEYFISHITSDKQRLEVEKFFLEEELRERKIDQIPLEQRIEEINQELGVQDIDTVEYSLEVSNALNIVKDNFLFAKKNYSKKHDLDIHSFIMVNEPMINNQAIACNMSLDEFSEVLINYVES